MIKVVSVLEQLGIVGTASALQLNDSREGKGAAMDGCSVIA